MENTTINTELELRLDHGHLSGHVLRNGSAPREFEGWLGLIGAIDALVSMPEEENDRADR